MDPFQQFNSTIPPEDPEDPVWNSKPAWKLPGWAEPVMVVSILFGAMVLTRRRGYRITGGRPGPYVSTLDTDPSTSQSTDELLSYESDNDDDRQSAFAQEKRLPKTRTCCGMKTVQTPNTSRFKNNLHSRILQRFPFLIEMFYWVINYAFYRFTAIASNALFAGEGIWNVAQTHGIAVLEFEHSSWASLFFPIDENGVQQWFMHGHQDALTVLNKAYALIHIPGTVGYIHLSPFPLTLDTQLTLLPAS